MVFEKQTVIQTNRERNPTRCEVQCTICDSCKPNSKTGGNPTRARAIRVPSRTNVENLNLCYRFDGRENNDGMLCHLGFFSAEKILEEIPSALRSDRVVCAHYDELYWSFLPGAAIIIYH